MTVKFQILQLNKFSDLKTAVCFLDYLCVNLMFCLFFSPQEYKVSNFEQRLMSEIEFRLERTPVEESDDEVQHDDIPTGKCIAPVFEKKLKNFKAMEGVPVTFTCKVLGIPLPKVRGFLTHKMPILSIFTWTSWQTSMLLLRFIGSRTASRSWGRTSTTGRSEKETAPALYTSSPRPATTTATTPSWPPTHRFICLLLSAFFPKSFSN